jgi:hypothetical protein
MVRCACSTTRAVTSAGCFVDSQETVNLDHACFKGMTKIRAVSKDTHCCGVVNRDSSCEPTNNVGFNCCNNWHQLLFWSAIVEVVCFNNSLGYF